MWATKIEGKNSKKMEVNFIVCIHKSSLEVRKKERDTRLRERTHNILQLLYQPRNWPLWPKWWLWKTFFSLPGEERDGRASLVLRGHKNNTPTFLFTHAPKNFSLIFFSLFLSVSFLKPTFPPMPQSHQWIKHPKHMKYNLSFYWIWWDKLLHIGGQCVLECGNGYHF